MKTIITSSILVFNLFFHECLFSQEIKNTDILLIKWAMTVDNAEGSGGYHGPLGSLHIRLYNSGNNCYNGQANYPGGLVGDLILPGPTENEWDDGDYKEWEPYGYYLWDWALPEIKVFLYESDPNFIIPGLREHDPVFCSNISTSSFTSSDRIVLGGPYYANDDAIARAWQRRPDNMNMLLTMLQQQWPEEYQRIQNGGKFYKMYIGFKHTGVPFIQQTISFEPGWNLVSFRVPVEGQKLFDLIHPLLSSNKIDRVLDQNGNLITWLPAINGGGSWVDSIGYIQNTQGYSVLATQPCSIQISGIRIDGPVAVPLKASWNILGYCVPYPSLATHVVQPLIDAGILYKVIDEDGNEIKFIAGMWINTIGYFNPGKAYYVKVTEDTILTIE